MPCVMYRYSPVIPNDFQASLPETHRKDQPHHGEASCDHDSQITGPYSRYMSASALSIIASAVLLVTGGLSSQLASVGLQEMILWTWGLPIMAGSLAAYGMVLQWAKRDEESKRKTRGRSLFGLIVAILIPRLALYFHPAFVGILNDMWALFGIGALIFIGGYGAAVGVMKWVETRAGDKAFEQLDKYADEKLPPKKPDDRT